MAPTYNFVDVPLLGGVKAHYALGAPLDDKKPSVLLIPGFITNLDLFEIQFSDEDLVRLFNLVAVDPLGHGKTSVPKSGHWTYWDQATMMIQVMEALGVQSWFVVGTAQGGWTAPRMSLMAAEQIRGMVIMGTSQDSESDDTRALGCWDGAAVLDPLIAAAAEPAIPNPEEWAVEESFVSTLLGLALGNTMPTAGVDLWRTRIMTTYSGEEGRKKAWMSWVSIRDRDSIRARVRHVECPVTWIHGTTDPIFSVANAEKEIKLFTGSPKAHLEIVDNGSHYTNATHPEPVKKALLDMYNATL